MSSTPRHTRALSRREFLQAAGLAGASLLVSFYLPGCDSVTPMPVPGATSTPQDQVKPEPSATAAAEPAFEYAPNAYLRIDETGLVTILVPRSEMGQGVQTALPMIVADELEADWAKIRLEQAPPNSVYGDQVTGGSVSISTSFLPCRNAGAAARILLIQAAAQTWDASPEDCYAELGQVIHRPSDKRLGYGELVKAASELPVPKGKEVILKDPKDFRLIGKELALVDGPHFANGSAMFGSDVNLPGMLTAMVERQPSPGATVESFDGTQAETVPGVRHVVQIDSGVAVVADDTWSAIKGRQALKVTWKEGEGASLTSEGIYTALEQAAQAIAQGEAPNPDAAKQIEAVYYMPYLAHATMEPMNATADVRADGCDVWAPTQNRQEARTRAIGEAGVPSDKLNVHVPFIGCGCGRRIETDYVVEAVQLSRAVQAPVKVFWDREDDVRHDYYRPASYHWLRGSLDAAGVPLTWTHVITSPGITRSPSSSEIAAGASDLPYKLRKSVRPQLVRIPINTTYWRAVYNTNNAFVNESFFDEMAAAAGRDPLEMRMAMITEKARLGVLELAADKAGWGSALPEGHARGIALHSSWGVTHVVHIAEVSVEDNGRVRVHKVVCAVDCGTVINPLIVKAQMEGGIAFGLAAAFKGEVTFTGGHSVQTNFHDYPILLMEEMPEVEVYIVQNGDAPTGVGEMSNPHIGAAVTNAIFSLTGKRIRQLPIRAADLRD